MKFFITFFFGVFLNAASDTSIALRFSGATTIQPIVEALGDEYYKVAKQKLFIEGGGSQSGLQKIEQENSDIAMVSRNLTDYEKSSFEYITIAYDAVAIIYNKSESDIDLTKDKIIKIYDGTIKKCKDIDWKCKDLIVISKKIDRGTLAVFESYIGLKSPKHKDLPKNVKLIRADAWEAEANINTLLWVSGLKGSIGYVSYGEAKRYENMSYPIHIGSIDGVYPSIENIKNKRYPITRELNLVWNKENQKAAKFIEWIKNSPIFKQSVEKFGFVAVDR